MCKRLITSWIPTLLFLMLFVFSVFRFEVIEQVLAPLLGQKNLFESRMTLPQVTGQHILIVLISSSIAITIGIGLGLLTRFSWMKEFEEFLLGAATFGQTIPTVAALAILVPIMGYGMTPLLIALFLYGLLPVLRNTVEGINSIPEGVRESGKAMGMNTLQILKKIELPLALPAILSGIKISVILNISVATIGALVGTGGLGTLIMNGIRSNDILLLLKGAIPVSLMALAAESIFNSMEKTRQFIKNHENII